MGASGHLSGGVGLEDSWLHAPYCSISWRHFLTLLSPSPVICSKWVSAWEVVEQGRAFGAFAHSVTASLPYPACPPQHPALLLCGGRSSPRCQGVPGAADALHAEAADGSQSSPAALAP